MFMDNVFRVAGYLRLSREDRGNMQKGGSDSIQSQREMISEFVSERENMEIAEFYVDDGYSGIHFERPGFQRMMRDVEAGKIDCVIVKDLSRLGRDYIEAGRLIQRIFPAFSVRFIAITDRYDSLTADQMETCFLVPLKNFVNDSYCRDISMKVRSHQEIKRRQGKFIGAFAPYGYSRDSTDPNKLAVDGYAAEIVKQIFLWKILGMSCRAIARRLNDWGILPPLEHKRLHGENYASGFETGSSGRWSATAVVRILMNQVYTGTMVQGRREKISYKVGKLRTKPEAEWIKVDHTHSPIVSRATYNSAVQVLKEEGRNSCRGDSEEFFHGILFCGDCKGRMIRRRVPGKEGERDWYICSRKHRGNGCSRHGVRSDILREILVKVLDLILFLNGNGNLERGVNAEDRTERWKWINYEMYLLTKKRNEYGKILNRLEQDTENTYLSEEEKRCWSKWYGERYRVMDQAVRGQELLIGKLSSGPFQNEQEREGFRLRLLVSRIEVLEGKRLQIQLSFSDRRQGRTP